MISKACALPEWVRTRVVLSCELQCEKLRQFTLPCPLPLQKNESEVKGEEAKQVFLRFLKIVRVLESPS